MTNVNSADAHSMGATGTHGIRKQVPSGIVTVGFSNINIDISVNLDQIFLYKSNGNV